MANGAESAAEHCIGRQTEIHDVKYVEELGAKFEVAQFAIASFSKRSVFDQSHVEIVEARSAKSVAAERAKNALIRACSTGDVYRNKEEGAVISTAAEIILSDGAARGEVRHRHQIGTVRSAGTDSRLLNSGIYGKW